MKKNEKKDLCPVAVALKVISGKWRLQIIHEIGNKTRRFGELKRLIPEISEKMLIQELKKLTQEDILKRKAYHEIPPRVEYTLTKQGADILPIIEEIKHFGATLIEKAANNR